MYRILIVFFFLFSFSKASISATINFNRSENHRTNLEYQKEQQDSLSTLIAQKNTYFFVGFNKTEVCFENRMFKQPVIFNDGSGDDGSSSSDGSSGDGEGMGDDEQPKNVPEVWSFDIPSTSIAAQVTSIEQGTVTPSTNGGPSNWTDFNHISLFPTYMTLYSGYSLSIGNDSETINGVNTPAVNIIIICDALITMPNGSQSVMCYGINCFDAE